MDAKMQESASQQEQELQRVRDSQQQSLTATRQQLQSQIEAAAEADARLQGAQQQLQEQQQHLQQLTEDLTKAQATKADTVRSLKQKEHAQRELHCELQALKQETTVLRQQLNQDQQEQLAGTQGSEQHAEVSCGSAIELGDSPGPCNTESVDVTYECICVPQKMPCLQCVSASAKPMLLQAESMIT